MCFKASSLLLRNSSQSEMTAKLIINYSNIFPWNPHFSVTFLECVLIRLLSRLVLRKTCTPNRYYILHKRRQKNWTFVAWNFIRTIFYITKKWEDKDQYISRIWERKSFREFGDQFQLDIFFVSFCWINLLPKNIQIGEFEMQRLLLSFPKSELNLIIVFSWCSWFFGQNLPIERQWAICAFTSIANQEEFVLLEIKTHFDHWRLKVRFHRIMKTETTKVRFKGI